MDTISEDDFDSKFDPIAGDDGSTLRELEAVRDADTHHVWTVVDGENGVMYALAGFHIVNQVGYVVTREPWTDPDTVAVWSSPVDAPDRPAE